MTHPLDRAVFSALGGRQAEVSEGGALAKRFASRFGPLAGLADRSEEAVQALFSLDLGGEGILLLDPDPPDPGPGVIELYRGPGLQMILGALSAGGAPVEARALGAADAPMMQTLAAVARPGPFASHTHELGDFLGIFGEGKLLAMAGERLRPDGFAEISGVCTDPEHWGRGLAGGLTRLVAERIRDRGETPFLHAHADNEPAIALYLRLGFQPRLRVWAAAYGRTRESASNLML